MVHGTATVNSVQVLRFVAALMIVVLHANNRTGWVHEGFDPDAGAWLSAGVDVFFVISGFIMAYIVRPTDSPGSFARKRFLRVAPLYWLVTFVALALTLIAPAYGFKGATLAGAFHSITFTTLRHPLFDVGWTLEYEMLFYMTLALCLFAGRQWLSILVAFILTSSLVSAAFSSHSAIFSWYGANLMMLEFLGGVLIFHVYRNVGLSPAFGLGLAVLGLVLMPFMENLRSEWPRAIAYGLPAMLIVCGFVMMERWFGRWSRGLVYLGDASYSIYLGHFLVLSPIGRLLSKSAAWKAFAVHWIYTTAFLTVCGIAGGLLLYHFVEKPLRSLLRGVGRPAVSSAPT